MHIARYEKRLFAYLFDYALALALAIVLFFALPLPLGVVFKIVLTQIAASLIYGIFAGAASFVFNGYTLGFSFVKVRIVRIDEKRLDAKTAFLRSFMLAIFPWAIINAFYMLIVHTERTIFDRISATLSIDRKCY